MAKLHIGEGLALPKDVVTSTLIVYGGKGMGKTNFGSVLVEELTKNSLRWAVLDPIGVWWGLRHSKDGKGPGIECLILGGTHGDIPIEPTGGVVAADLVADEEVNVLIDFSRKPSGEMWGIGEKTRFVTEYASRLFQRQGELISGHRREPLFQVLDEAARYIPQMLPAGNPELAKCLSAWNMVVEEGRNIGLGVGLLTQRSARMNKSVSELADAMIAFRTVGPNSIAAIMDWMGEHVAKAQIKELVEEIRQLDRGTCMVVSPGWLKFESTVAIRERETFDSSATPKPGERDRKVSGDAAKPDLANYLERMRATIERAKADDPKELKKRIAELEREAKKKAPTGAPVADPNKKFDTKAIERAVREATTPLRKQLESIQRGAKEVCGFLYKANVKLGEMASLELPKLETPKLLPQEQWPKPVAIERPTTPIRPAREVAESNGNITNPQHRILAALADFDAIGRTAIPKSWIAARAGVSHSSGSFANNLGALRTLGMIDYPSTGMVSITPEGLSHTPAVDSPLTTDEMLTSCENILTNPQAAILRVLHAEHPKSLSKDELAERVNVSASSGSFANNLGAIRSAGMIDYPSKGMVRCSDWLFID